MPWWIYHLQRMQKSKILISSSTMKSIVPTDKYVNLSKYYIPIPLLSKTKLFDSCMKFKTCFKKHVIWMYWSLGVKWNYEKFNALYCCNLNSCTNGVLYTFAEIDFPSFSAQYKALGNEGPSFPKNGHFWVLILRQKKSEKNVHMGILFLGRIWTPPLSDHLSILSDYYQLKFWIFVIFGLFHE